MNKNSNITWGLIFVAAALLVLLGKLEVFGDISIFTIATGILFIIISIWGLLHRNFYIFLFFLAFFFIISNDAILDITDGLIDISKITLGPILVAALLGSIGLSMIFPKKNSHIKNYAKKEHFDNIVNEADESEVKCYIQFGAVVKYVNTTSLTKADIYCSFGAIKIYFDAAKTKDRTANINLNVSFGGVDIYVPKNWEIDRTASATIGGIDIQGAPDSVTDATVTLTGNVRFGGVTIHYV